MTLATFKSKWDFSLLDTGNGYRLEQWGDIRLARPDPQIIWGRSLPAADWGKADATFSGEWKTNHKLPASWVVNFNETKLKARLTPFKHTGIFAEQAANWEWMLEQTAGAKKLNILNLFGYTGAASVILAQAGHSVTHVDASRPAITWAKENQSLNHLPQDSIRWMLDDAAKFVQREIKRGKSYDGILMDPPAFGHSPSGKTWKFNKDLPELLSNCISLLSPNAKFLLINGYAINSSAIVLNNFLEDSMVMRSQLKGRVEFGELCLQQKNQRMISTGIFARWSYGTATSRAAQK
jgi:23S rRNA (cytosine1962-C5)-methyltransferase